MPEVPGAKDDKRLLVLLKDMLSENRYGDLIAATVVVGCGARADDTKTQRRRESSVDLTNGVDEFGVRTGAARQLPVCQREVATLEISIHEQLVFSAAKLRDDISNLLRERGMPNKANTEIEVRSSAVRFSKRHDIDMIKRGKQRVEGLFPTWTLGRQK
jgi:hypothetical protein